MLRSSRVMLSRRLQKDGTRAQAVKLIVCALYWSAAACNNDPLPQVNIYLNKAGNEMARILTFIDISLQQLVHNASKTEV